MKFLLNIILLLLLSSCSNTEKNNKTTRKLSKNKVIVKDSISKTSSFTLTSDSSYCYITDIIINNDEVLLEVDFIQFFTFDEALIEAKKRGKAEYNIDEKGDTTFMVYNDYFITNDSPKLRYFKITDSTKIKYIKEFGEVPFYETQLNKYLKRVAYSPFNIKTKNGLIKSLEEIYIP